MGNSTVRKLVLGSLATLLVSANAAGASDVTGTWTGNPLYMIVKQEGASLTGTGGPGKGEQVPMNDGRVEGDRLTFRLGQFRFDLRVVGADEIKGEMQGPKAHLSIYLKRTKPASSPPAFDVASIKRSPPITRDTRVEKKVSIGRFTCRNATMRNLIMGAYSVKDYQISGPDWMDSQGYDINATMPPTASPDDAMLMLQPLLAERLKMTVHRETRELPVYALVAAKGGIKAREVEWEFAGVSRSPGRVTSSSTRMEDLAVILSRQLNRPVLDMTGIKGYFEVSLEWTPERGPGREGNGSDTAGPSIFRAVQEQLGLKLESRKAPVEMIIVDHVEREPIEN